MAVRKMSRHSTAKHAQRKPPEAVLIIGFASFNHTDTCLLLLRRRTPS